MEHVCVISTWVDILVAPILSSDTAPVSFKITTLFSQATPVFFHVTRVFSQAGGAGNLLMEHMLTFRNFSNSPPTYLPANQRTKNYHGAFRNFPRRPPPFLKNFHFLRE